MGTSYLIMFVFVLTWTTIWYWNSAVNKGQSKIIWVLIGIGSGIFSYYQAERAIETLNLFIFDLFICFLICNIGILFSKFLLNHGFKENIPYEDSENRTIIIGIIVSAIVVALLVIWEKFNILNIKEIHWWH
jgi:hypothetical protein